MPAKKSKMEGSR